jgi:hypothetical protein
MPDPSYCYCCNLNKTQQHEDKMNMSSLLGIIQQYGPVIFSRHERMLDLGLVQARHVMTKTNDAACPVTMDT